MATTTSHADGKSPLSCYVDLLISVPTNLELLLDRDAEAVRILTATSNTGTRQVNLRTSYLGRAIRSTR